jgi:hypothetical protein
MDRGRGYVDLVIARDQVIGKPGTKTRTLRQMRGNR